MRWSRATPSHGLDVRPTFPAVEDLTALALAARGGDPAALSSFVRTTWGEVARLVTAVAGRQLAEDATQDAYLRAIRALPAFRGESSARTWLLAIARRAAVDAVRATARRRRLTGRLAARAEAHITVDVGLDDLTLTEQLLGRLDTDRRTAFALTQLMGLSYAEAAAVCGCPVGTIRSRVARARDDLVRHLGTAEPPPGLGPGGRAGTA
jgi:RNA polymerase sigma-70 factor (ECF subfamily)